MSIREQGATGEQELWEWMCAAAGEPSASMAAERARFTRFPTDNEAHLEQLVMGERDLPVVELGCGDGTNLLLICRQNQVRGTGIDFSPTQLGRARASDRDGVAEWVCGDAADPAAYATVGSGQVRAISIFGALQFSNPERVLRALSAAGVEIARIAVVLNDEIQRLVAGDEDAPPRRVHRQISIDEKNVALPFWVMGLNRWSQEFRHLGLENMARLEAGGAVILIAQRITAEGGE